MIISRTPYRISFFGGGSDYPAWYLREGGVVLSTTIDKYCYISCRYLPPFFNIKHRIVWSHIETVTTLKDILHPAVRECLKYMGFDDALGLEIHHQGDLPARSGMGSSSSFSVGLIHALTALRGQTIGKHELALKAIELEQNVMKDSVGAQDQVAAAHGGLNRIRFLKSGKIDVEPVKVAQDRHKELESNLIMLYTGMVRTASDVAKEVSSNLERKSESVLRMMDMAEEGAAILAGKASVDDFGALLDEAWQLKRGLAEAVSNDVIDGVYRTAKANGALGGKLLGAGAGGFMLFYIPPGKQRNVQRALSQYLWVPFSFESTGSSIIATDGA
ncbi:MAG: kinase [Euryarchaeota archaeon]|nr:kinase [Euryarchaeota archaeon]